MTHQSLSRGRPRSAPGRPTSGLRVAIISPSFGGFGGLEAFVLAIAAGLPPSPEIDVRVFFKETRGFIRTPTLQAAIAPLGDRVRFVARAGRDLLGAIAWADVVHAQNPSPDVVVLAKLLRRTLLINVINHRQPGRSLHHWLWRWALRQAVRRFYISDFVRQTWEGNIAWSGSRVVFPICELAEGMCPVAERRGFVFAARWIANKGLDTLIDAYAEARLDPAMWPLTLIGDGPLRPEMERRVSERGLRGIRMPGFVSAAEKADLIRNARWMVVPPNTREDFGLTAIEARNLGVPCVITRDGGVPEAAGDMAIVCAPGSVAELVAALREAAAMPDAEYRRRALRTHETLLPRLARPSYYAATYRDLHAG
ncbi:MAG TPA: glycosyltransferase family 4 protein [Opitutaceae bacterium]|nr:glycosyltransferase family 4 protein [Opitutaceae bacterium]